MRKITHEAPAADKPKHHKIVKATELPKLEGHFDANISPRHKSMCLCVDSIVTAKGLSSDLELISVGQWCFSQLFTMFLWSGQSFGEKIWSDLFSSKTATFSTLVKLYNKVSFVNIS